ncbi:tetratricopeptide repeat protein [Sporomusa aerivorans]|uniref:tetratricopeptide repeat protein n=1 Tax=Sporomusa aerivorans TaxID=204936 RepID=UPI00352B4566
MIHNRIAFRGIIFCLSFFVSIMPFAVYGAESSKSGVPILQKVAQEYYLKGLEYADRNEFKLAIEQYDQAIALYPKSADYYLKRGEALFKNQQIEQSIKDFTKAIEVQPGKYKSYLVRARSYIASNQKDKAIADMEQSVKICTDGIKRSPKDTEKYIDRGQAYMMLEDYENAANDFSKVLELDSRSDAAFVRRGIAYAMEHEYDLAIIDFNKAITLNSNNDEAFLIRAEIYFLGGNLERAIQDYSEVIRLKPANSVAYAQRGYVYMMSGQAEKAREDSRKAESIDKKIADSAGWMMAIGSISYSHITGNVPEKSDFDAFLLRAIMAYFSAGPNAEIKYEFLRKGPDQVGVSPPDYYLWVEINDNNKRQTGAMRVTAIDKKGFVIPDFLTKDTIEKDFSEVYKIFPLTVCLRIANKIKKEHRI